MLLLMRSITRILTLSVALALLVGGGWLALSITRTIQLQREVARLEVEIEIQKEICARTLCKVLLVGCLRRQLSRPGGIGRRALGI